MALYIIITNLKYNSKLVLILSFIDSYTRSIPEIPSLSPAQAQVYIEIMLFTQLFIIATDTNNYNYYIFYSCSS